MSQYISHKLFLSTITSQIIDRIPFFYYYINTKYVPRVLVDGSHLAFAYFKQSFYQQAGVACFYHEKNIFQTRSTKHTDIAAVAVNKALCGVILILLLQKGCIYLCRVILTRPCIFSLHLWA